VPLLERESTFDTFRDAVSRAERGIGSMVVLAGEAGMGKSALVLSFGEEIADRARVFMGACDDLVTPPAFGPWRDVARAAGGALADALDSGAESAVVLQAIVDVASADADPCFLVVEDVHWADDATLDSLRYLSRRIADLPLVVIVTYRPEELSTDHPLLGVLGQLHGDSFHRITLEPLTRSAVKELAAGSDRDPGELHRVTGGNPFFVREVLAAAGGGVPATVRDAVVSRLRHLTAEARDVIGLVAVAPGGLEHELVAHLSGDVLDAVSEAEEHGILEGDESRLRFHNELARRAVEEAMTEATRRSVNRRVLDALQSVNADGARLLHHAVAAGEVDVVMRFAPDEARLSASSGAHRQAAAWFELALSHEGRLDPLQRAQMLHDYAVELHRLHRLEDAARTAKASVAAWEELGDASGLGRAIIELARNQYFLGDTEAAHESTERAVAVLEEGGNDEALASAYTSLAALYVWRHRMLEALPWGEKACRLARSIDRPDILARALNYLGVAKLLTGDDSGFDDLTEAASTAERIGHAEHHARGAINLATALFSNLLYEEGVATLQESVEVAVDSELLSQEYDLRALLGQGLLMLGRWDEAERELRPLVERATDDLVAVSSFGYLGRLLMRRGLDEGDELIDRGLAVTGVDESLLRYGSVATAAIERAWLAGDAATAARLHSKVLEMAAAVDSLDWVGTVTLYASRAGLDVSPPDPCPPSFLYGILGDWERAAAAWGEVGDPYERAIELVFSKQEEPGLEGLQILEDLGAARTVQWARTYLGL
jgi:tetratricopeptide (TPR) repeat protein